MMILFNFFNNFYGMGGQTSGETMGFDVLARVAESLDEGDIDLGVVSLIDEGVISPEASRIGTLVARNGSSSAANDLLMICTSLRRRLEEPATTVTVQASRSKDARVKLRISLARRPVSMASRYSR